ncbi:hypothetical protein BDN72DRAFT_899133 [Pluteus cervinus]|uniref:Uncharacterized protein n=1 Tax=Pluteus cervinus TaxID=181527 RepID=A0ACD3APQ5_9AGAR|nr:hypothetical protein BDN72DRAFT_899133 [Pluteus cervinus]
MKLLWVCKSLALARRLNISLGTNKNKRTQETSDIDDRTMHEIYAHPFLKSVMAGVASMRCSYNPVDNTYTCENDRAMNDIIEREYGFQGSGVSSTHMHPGLVVDRILEHIRPFRPSLNWILHQDSPSYPSFNFDAFKTDSEEINRHVDVQADHWKLVRTIGAASTVLLKNTNNALPLESSLRSLVTVGSDGGPGRAGPNAFVDQGGDVGVLMMGWGSGTANFTSLGNGDRNNLTAWHNGDNLVLAVAAQNNNTIVVVHSVGPLILELWIDHPNVTVLLWAGLQGEEAGHSIADVLFSDFNLLGKLPHTTMRDLADYSAQRIIGGHSQDIITILYTEGFKIDYQHFDTKNIMLQYEFSFRLSYMAFSYSNLKITKLPSTD